MLWVIRSQLLGLVEGFVSPRLEGQKAGTLLPVVLMAGQR